MSQNGLIRSLQVGKLKVEAYESTEAMGKAAAESAAESLRALAARSDTVAVIFATGASQMSTLEALTSIPGLPWDKVVGFHMDEYLGIPDDHRASFRRYLRERLTSKVKMRQFYGVDGTSGNPEETCRKYAELLRQYNPQLCLLGIGENGHLAFNDPAEANFEDPQDIRIVSLDDQCRQQQVNEKWFDSLAEVPKQAITLTIPTLLRVPRLISSVPGERKAHIVYRTLTEEISTHCPATIMRNHPDTTVYLDPASAVELPA
ncbi:MAG TPA: glucosamine-6-phosphate deaminase [Terriglobia bacterium]|nr:glucosamine-6-phosphate deaminase [Terriglobia bacterium]